VCFCKSLETFRLTSDLFFHFSISSTVASSVTRVFVGNVSYETNEEKIVEIFSAVPGFQGIYFARHADSEKPKGWALISFSSDEAAADCIQKFDGKNVSGRKLFLRLEMDATDHDPSFNVYIGNLPFRSFHDEDLSRMLKPRGAYYCRLKIKTDGSSRGFGLAKFDTEADALKAIAELSGSKVSGREIEVRMDRGPILKNSHLGIYVSNLPYSVTDEDCRRAFEKFGAISSVSIQKSADRKPWATLTFDSEDAAFAAANAMNKQPWTVGSPPSGEEITCRIDRKSPTKQTPPSAAVKDSEVPRADVPVAPESAKPAVAATQAKIPSEKA
jgi:polyadenylate-binding protein